MKVLGNIKKFWQLCVVLRPIPFQRDRRFASPIENEKVIEELRLYALSGRDGAKEGLRLVLLTMSPSPAVLSDEGSDDAEDADVLREPAPARAPAPPPPPPRDLEGEVSYFFPQPFSASFSWYFSA